MTCRHSWEVVDVDHNGGQYGPAIMRWCRVCRDYVSMGTANDTSLTVKLEKRAVELGGKRRGTPAERAGWDAHKYGGDPIGPAQWAGYLARVIASHEEEQGNER